VTLAYRFESEGLPELRMKLKVEINTREHFTVFGLRSHRFEVASRWFSGAAGVLTYNLRVPAQADHRFRGKPITHSGGSRSPIPEQADR
jgi:hypothetical protein